MKKAWRVCITAGIMAAAMSFGSFAGQWKQNDVGWWYDNEMERPAGVCSGSMEIRMGWRKVIILMPMGICWLVPQRRTDTR